MIEINVEIPQRETIESNVNIIARPIITGVTASVDDSTGTPYVDVTPTGTETEFSFNLAFHNLKGDQGEKGDTGETGQDGVSPIASVEQTASGCTITIIDGSGTTTADLTNGQDGTDGFSPVATVTQTLTGATISIEDASGTTTADITNGVDGTDGQDGQSAEITGATASVSNTVGIPTVTVTSGGTPLSRSFNFAFENLKGEKGDKGDTTSAAWGTISGTLSDQTDLQTELTGLQSQIDTINLKQNVVDVIGTYAELQLYDTSTLTVNDEVGVLQDETHDGAYSVYTWNGTSFTYRGSTAPSYTKSQTNTLLDGKANTDIQTIQDITTLSSGTITLSSVSSIYKITPASNTTFTFNTSGLSLSSAVAYTFELYINMSTVYSLTFPSSLTWQGGTAPDLSATGTYFLVFRTIDGGINWIGNLQGVW